MHIYFKTLLHMDLCRIEHVNCKLFLNIWVLNFLIPFSELQDFMFFERKN